MHGQQFDPILMRDFDLPLVQDCVPRHSHMLFLVLIMVFMMNRMVSSGFTYAILSIVNWAGVPPVLVFDGWRAFFF